MASSVDFTSHLAKQIRFLESSCREYDAENLDEAIRIATALRVLFHHTGQSTSLLMHLRATHVFLLSSCGRRASKDPRGWWPGLFNVEMCMDNLKVRCLPILGSKPSLERLIPFSAWWESEIVHFGAGIGIKRRSLVLAAANKDGGAHVDTRLPDDYQWLADGASFTFAVQRKDGSSMETALPSPHLACLRQIAYEVLNSPDVVRLGVVENRTGEQPPGS